LIVAFRAVSCCIACSREIVVFSLFFPIFLGHPVAGMEQKLQQNRSARGAAETLARAAHRGAICGSIGLDRAILKRSDTRREKSPD